MSFEDDTSNDKQATGGHSSQPSTGAEPTRLDRRTLLRNAMGASALGLGASMLPREAHAHWHWRMHHHHHHVTTSFALAVLPDTQFYSRYATSEEGQAYQRQYGSTPYPAQTQFIVDNAAKYHIPFTIHLGDVVDQSKHPQQWAVADAAMKVLENAGRPYSVLAGNHDVLSALEFESAASQSSGTDAQRGSSEPYLTWFPTSRAAKQRTFLERHPSGWHEAHVFHACGVSFMVLSLSWRASDDAIAWAHSMIARYPMLPVILANHQLLNIANDGVSPLEVAYGQYLWDKLIRHNDQIFMTLNGHYHGGALLTKINDFHNPVHEMVVDYQMAYQGGNGLMRLYEFDFTRNKIDVASFSPWVVEKPKDSLKQFDRAWLTEPNHEFSIDIDFQRRFSRFTHFCHLPAFAGTPILPRVKQDLYANYTEQPEPVVVPPTSEQDYPLIAETVAHWRITSSAIGKAVAAGTALADLTAANPMQRAALAGAAQVADVAFTADKHRLSSAPGSVQFLNTTHQGPGRFSWFTTAANAPINAATFANGYTIETFIKIDPNWKAADHAWCNILTRFGNRGWLPGYAGGDPESPPILFAISNLREVQWEIVPSSSTKQPQTDWSGEIMLNTWYHLAIVNDPKDNSTVLYIEGAPVVRSVIGGNGIASVAASQPWALGCGWWDRAPSDGFLGSIGEVRVVSKPLAPNQWLTARRASA
jgi:hypothetical protein